MQILLKGLTMGDWLSDILVKLCIYIENVVYTVARWLLKAFYDIVTLSSKLTINGTNIGFIIRRFMVLAAVYALFRLAIMMIQFLINPDDKKAPQMGAKLIKNVLVAVVLLVSSGFIFDSLVTLQERVLIGYKSDSGETPGLIPMIIYGRENVSDVMSSDTEARAYVNKVWLEFFTPKTENCNNDEVACNYYGQVKSGNKDISVMASFVGSFDYIPIVPFVVGIYLIFVFFSAAFEVARRLFKLIVLQIIYPVPVIMSIDPFQKDNKIAAFFKAYFGVYLEVFIRVASFQLAVVVIDVIKKLLEDNNLFKTNPFIFLILLIGIFQASKELPQLLEKAIGVKMDGGKHKSFGAVAAGLLGGTAGFLAGGIAARSQGGSFLAGAGRGAWQGGSNMSKAKNVREAVSGAYKNIGNQAKFGKDVHDKGGLRHYMASTILPGHDMRSQSAKKTADRYDEMVAERDKQYSKESEKRALRHAEQLRAMDKDQRRRSDVDFSRANIDKKMDENFLKKYGDVDKFMASDVELQTLLTQQQEDMKNEAVPASVLDDRQKLINERRSVLADQYREKKKQYYNDQIAIANTLQPGQSFDTLVSSKATELSQAQTDLNTIKDTINGMYGDNVDFNNPADIERISDEGMKAAYIEAQARLTNAQSEYDTFERYQESYNAESVNAIMEHNKLASDVQAELKDGVNRTLNSYEDIKNVATFEAETHRYNNDRAAMVSAQQIEDEDAKKANKDATDAIKANKKQYIRDHQGYFTQEQIREASRDYADKTSYAEDAEMRDIYDRAGANLDQGIDRHAPGIEMRDRNSRFARETHDNMSGYDPNSPEWIAAFEAARVVETTTTSGPTPGPQGTPQGGNPGPQSVNPGSQRGPQSGNPTGTPRP